MVALVVALFLVDCGSEARPWERCFCEREIEPTGFVKGSEVDGEQERFFDSEHAAGFTLQMLVRQCDEFDRVDPAFPDRPCYGGERVRVVMLSDLRSMEIVR